MSQSLNDKAFYRTAPATPGLLKSSNSCVSSCSKETKKNILKHSIMKNQQIYFPKTKTLSVGHSPNRGGGGRDQT